MKQKSIFLFEFLTFFVLAGLVLSGFLTHRMGTLAPLKHYLLGFGGGLLLALFKLKILKHQTNKIESNNIKMILIGLLMIMMTGLALATGFGSLALHQICLALFVPFIFWTNLKSFFFKKDQTDPEF